MTISVSGFSAAHQSSPPETHQKLGASPFSSLLHREFSLFDIPHASAVALPWLVAHAHGRCVSSIVEALGAETCHHLAIVNAALAVLGDRIVSCDQMQVVENESRLTANYHSCPSQSSTLPSLPDLGRPPFAIPSRQGAGLPIANDVTRILLIACPCKTPCLHPSPVLVSGPLLPPGWSNNDVFHHFCFETRRNPRQGEVQYSQALGSCHSNLSMAFCRCPKMEEACSVLWAAESGSCGGLGIPG